MAKLKAEWMAREDLAALVDALGAGNVRWVGGAVRDTLLGHPVKDIDAADPAHVACAERGDQAAQVLALHPIGLQNHCRSP